MSDVISPDEDEPRPEPKKPRIAKVRLSITKVEARRMTRIVRWERRSAKTCLTLGPDGDPK